MASHDHVDLVGSLVKGLLCFQDFYWRCVRAKRKTYNSTDFHRSTAQQISNQTNVIGIRADCEESAMGRFLTEKPNVRLRGILLEVSVVKFTREFVFSDQRRAPP